MKLETEFDDIGITEERKINKSQIITVIIGVFIILFIFLLGIYIRSKVTQTTETVVERYMDTYATGMSEEDLNDLVKSISGRIDSSLEEMNTKELSDENLQQLLDDVMIELCNSSYSIPESEISRIASEVVKKVLEINEKNNAELLAKYSALIDSLTSRVTELEMAEKNRITETDVQNLIDNSTLTQEEIINLLNNYYSTDVLIQKLSQKLNISTEDIYKMITENRNYTDNIYKKLSESLGMSSDDIKKLMSETKDIHSTIELISQKTNLSVQDIYKAISEAAELTNEELLKLNSKLKLSNEELLNLINSTSSSLSNAINYNKQITDAYIQETDNKLTNSIGDTNNKLTEADSRLTSSIGDTKNKLTETDSRLTSSIWETNNKLTETDSRLTSSIGETNNKLSETDSRLTSIISNTKTELNTTINNTKNELSQNINMKAEIYYSLENSIPTLTIINVQEGDAP